MMINDDNYFRYRVETSYWTSANSSRSVGILPTFVNINECAGNLITKVYYTERSRGGGEREKRRGREGGGNVWRDFAYRWRQIKCQRGEWTYWIWAELVASIIDWAEIKRADDKFRLIYGRISCLWIRDWNSNRIEFLIEKKITSLASILSNTILISSITNEEEGEEGMGSFKTW